MKNTIWVGRNKNENSYQCDKELCIIDGCVIEKHSRDSLRPSDSYKYDIYGLNLAPLEIVQVTIDTETQTFTVKRERKLGWYLVKASSIIAMYWNGKYFIDGECKYSEYLFVAIDETPLTSPFMKGMKNVQNNQ